MKVAIVGLGYVGLPIALSFSKKYETIGFDINNQKIEKYKLGIDPTNEFDNDEIKNCDVFFTCEQTKLKEADFLIVAVPTPIDEKNIPDLTFLKNATELVARNLKLGATIVFESTVYPGTTEEICIPILESISGLSLNKSFFVGYSPERINAGDKLHSFDKINKIVSGSNKKTSSFIKKIYSQILSSNVIEVSSIKVAEASKIIENAQRDINIAFMNEVSKIFHLMGIDTNEVLEAAKTKWNFIDFTPGLVGGHCIGVDPYYLAHKAHKLGYVCEVILSGRKVNDSMGWYVANIVKQKLKSNGIKVRGAKILIKGIAFKENVSDIRNSKVVDIVKSLKNSGCKVFIEDYNVDKVELKNMYNLDLSGDVKAVDAIIVATKHREYLSLTPKQLSKLYNKKNSKKILFDLYSIYEKEKFEKEGFIIWKM